jgi:hypothetical protein
MQLKDAVSNMLRSQDGRLGRGGMETRLGTGMHPAGILSLEARVPSPRLSTIANDFS